MLSLVTGLNVVGLVVIRIVVGARVIGRVVGASVVGLVVIRIVVGA